MVKTPESKWNRILTKFNNPFTGYGIQNFENGQVEVLAQIKDGYVTRLKQWKESYIILL